VDSRKSRLHHLFSEEVTSADLSSFSRVRSWPHSAGERFRSEHGLPGFPFPAAGDDLQIVVMPKQQKVTRVARVA
jgi:hypothetical protein